jgi:hypothetical protein
MARVVLTPAQIEKIRKKNAKTNAKHNPARKKSGKLQVDNARHSAKRKAELEEKVAEIRKRKLEDPSTDVFEDKLIQWTYYRRHGTPSWLRS